MSTNTPGSDRTPLHPTTKPVNNHNKTAARNFLSQTSTIGLDGLYDENTPPPTTKLAISGGKRMTKGQKQAERDVAEATWLAQQKEESLVAVTPKDRTTIFRTTQSKPKSDAEIAKIQKQIAADHKTKLTALLTTYLPPALITPHPSLPTQLASPITTPSILDLELRHLQSHLPLLIYKSHIISRPDRTAFESAYRALESETADSIDRHVRDAMSFNALAKVREGWVEKEKMYVERMKTREGKRVAKMDGRMGTGESTKQAWDAGMKVKGGDGTCEDEYREERKVELEQDDGVGEGQDGGEAQEEMWNVN